MRLATLLEIKPGITAVIGSGGKTTLLRVLGEELAKEHSVLLCTSTKIRPFSDMPCAYHMSELEELRKQHRLLCAGTPLDNGKLTALECSMAELAARFDYVLVEADGAARLPLKAHASHEPVIPPEANQTICVVGASGFGRPICEVVHRPAIYATLANVQETADATVETEAAVLKTEHLHDRIYVNQVDGLSELVDAKAIAALLDCPVLAGSLQRGEYFCVSSDSRRR